MKSMNLSNSIVAGGKVCLTCMDERSMVYTTKGKEVKANRCSVRLVSCPDATSNVPTNFGGGRSGVKLNRPSLVYRDLVSALSVHYITPILCARNLTLLVMMIVAMDVTTNYYNKYVALVLLFCFFTYLPP
ncbi:hypothetical protein DVH24_019846 [Malus domestica]|uniref:Uncharacterized protein n=1 Tax=Malus domestica TaxID=3750 RepID=A0A498HZC3_MALDO|nr:hypothetical protein DVH24_019846 [Malus domestica]